MSLAGNSTSAGAGYQLISTGTLSLAGGNNVTLSQNANSVTISGASQSLQTQNRFNLTLAGNTAGAMAQVSSGTLSLAGCNNITLSQNANAVTISAAAQSIQTPSNIQGIMASGSTNRTGDISFANSNGVTFGLSNNTITASVAGGAQSVQTIGGYATGNTTGTSGTASNQIIFAGGNNITLSQSTGSGGNTLSIIGGSPTASINFSAGTTSSNLASISFANSNGVSFGLNGGTVTGAVATNYAASNHSHGNPTLNLTNMSGTTASASNGLTLSLSAAAQSVQTQSNIQGIIAGTSTANTGNISFANSNGIVFGLSNNTVTASVTGGDFYSKSEVDALLAGFASTQRYALGTETNIGTSTTTLIDIPGLNASYQYLVIAVYAFEAYTTPAGYTTVIGQLSDQADSLFAGEARLAGNAVRVRGTVSQQWLVTGKTGIKMKAYSTGAGVWRCENLHTTLTITRVG